MLTGYSPNQISSFGGNAVGGVSKTQSMMSTTGVQPVFGTNKSVNIVKRQKSTTVSKEQRDNKKPKAVQQPEVQQLNTSSTARGQSGLVATITTEGKS